MIKVLVGDIFESKAQTLVNTVNCVGVMGKGVALGFKKRFPDMYKDYVEKCKNGEVVLGKPYIYKYSVPPWVINFPTKDHWRSLARLDDIVTGLKYLLDHYREWEIDSMAVPPLGSGQGQLEWRVVGPVLYKYLSMMDVEVELYAPYGTPIDELQMSFLRSPQSSGQLNLRAPNFEWVSPAWFALVEALHRVETQPYHFPIGRTSFQKMAYVAKSLGLPLDIEFKKGSYGPFSNDLKPMLSRLVSNKLVKEEREGRLIRVLTDSSFIESRPTYLPEIQQWEEIIDKVSDLFMRVNTSQAEIIATVIYSANELAETKGGAITEQDVVDAVMTWKELRSPPLDVRKIGHTVRNLAALGWLEVKGSPRLKVL